MTRPPVPLLSRLSLLLLTCSLTAMVVTAAGATTITWNNAAGGAWSNPANWTPNNVPDVAGETAVLPALSGAYQVTLDVNPAIDALQIDAGDPTLDLNGYSIGSVPSVSNSGTIKNFIGLYDSGKLHNHSTGVVLGAVNGSIQMGGIITNDGRIVVGPGGSSMLATPTGLTLAGTGTLVLNESMVYEATGTKTLSISAGATFSGSGYISVPVVNYGTFENDHSQGLALQIDGILYNSGVVRVSHGGKINVNRPLMKNLGAIITSGTGGGTFTVVAASGNGGTLDCSQGGTIVADGGDLNLSCGTLMNAAVQRVGTTGAVAIGLATFQDVTVAAGAELSIPGHADMMAAMSKMVNNGTMRISGSFNFGILDGAYSIPIDGTGTTILEGGILGSGNGATLWNKSGQTIQGCGTINPPFINDGTVNLDCGGSLGKYPGSWLNRKIVRVRGGKFTVTGATTVFTNKGTLSTGGGTISVEKGATIDNTGGVISATGGNVALGNATTAGTVVGGTLESGGGSSFQVLKAATLRDVTLGATASLQTLGGATTTATGARFVNAGTNRIASLGTFAVDATTDYLQTGGATTLEGGTLTATRDVQIQSGALRGIGTIAGIVVNGGLVTPDAGRSPLRIVGNYRQAPGGTLQAALVASSQSSLLAVSGNAALDGTLYTLVAHGAAPAQGSRYGVLSYGTVTGQFAQYVGGLDPGSQLGLQPEYGNDALALVVTSTLGVGDSPALPRALRFYARFGPGGSSLVLELPKAASLRGRIYDASGREVARLADGAQAAGVHTFALSGAGAAVRTLPSGVYFARVTVTGADGTDVRTARATVLN